MKRLILSLLLTVSALALTAQTHLQEAITQMALQGKYLHEVVQHSSNPAIKTESYVSFYSYTFKMPRKAGRKQITAFLTAYNADISSPEVTMHALHIGKDGHKEQYVAQYSEDRKIFLGRDYDNLAFVRMPSTHGENYRRLAAIEWKEEGRRIEGRAYIIEAEQSPPSKAGQFAPSNFDWNKFEDAFKDGWKDKKWLRKQFDVKDKKGLKNWVDSITSQYAIISTDNGQRSIKIIENGDTITHLLPGDRDITLYKGKQPTSSKSKAIADYLHRFEFYEKSFTGRNTAYNLQLLREFIQKGRQLLPYMSLKELEATLEEASELMEDITESDRDATMLRELGAFMGECGMHISKLSLTETDESTREAIREAKKATKEAAREVEKAIKEAKKHLKKGQR